MNLLKARISDDSGKDQGQSYILNLCSILQKEFDSYVTMLLQKYELTDLSELIDSSSLLDNNLPVENTVDIEVMASVEEIHSLDTLLTQLESLKQEQQIAKTSLSEQNIAIEFVCLMIIFNVIIFRLLNKKILIELTRFSCWLNPIQKPF